MDAFVNVAVRIRPPLGEDYISTINLISEDPWVLEVDNKFQYKLDRIFTEKTGQLEIYNDAVKPLVEKVQMGFNCTVFAYGQTGTGKTYTMGSNPEAYDDDDPGFILRSIKDFMQNDNDEICVYISFFEIYNEKIYDLLSLNKEIVPVKGTQDLVKEKLVDLMQAKSILRRGSANRHVGETKQNSKSSRSHAILTIYFNKGQEITSKLNLVDLAGSESVKKTGNQGYQFQEGVNINKGLLSIGRVVNALTTNQAFIPYRESKITAILQDSLNKNSYITLIACVSPNPDDTRETIQTLEFSQDTKRIKNKPEILNLLNSHKKSSIYGPSKRSYLHNFTPISKRVKLVDTACSPFKPCLLTNYMDDDCLRSISVNVSSEFNANIDISPIIEEVVKGEITKLQENSNLQFKTCEEEDKENATPKKVETSPEFLKLESNNKVQNKNTPPNKFSWKNIESLVIETVRSQILQLTVQKPLACSSPKRLQFNENSKFQQDFLETPFQFKVPVVPKKHFTECKDSRIEEKVHFAEDKDLQVVENIELRRSTRLSLKRNNSQNDSIQFKQPAIPQKRAKVHKDQKHDPEISVDNFNKTIGQSEVDLRNVRRSVRIPVKKIQADFISNANTRDGISKKEKNKKSLKTKKEAKSAVNSSSEEDECEKSPKSKHRSYVLHILNNGNEAELQKLATVGPKTAAKIYVYRQVHGKFEKISDLGKTGFWRGNSFSRFLKENVID